ncbi:twin-arginine translocation signal domain-containing protein [Streptomyces sp. NPDC003015]
MTESGMTSGNSDRRGFLRGAAAAVATVGAGVLFSGSARAVQAHSQAGKALAAAFPLPPVGVEVPCSMYAANVPLKLNSLGALTLDFKGGINFKVLTTNTAGLVLEVLGFRMEADLSPSTPDSGTLVSLEQLNATLTPLSSLQASPSGGMEMLVRLSLTTQVIDKATGETVLLLSTDPTKYATLKATDVKAFPPVNQPYTLQEPVQLYLQGGSRAQGTDPAGTLEGFDVIVNQSA